MLLLALDSSHSTGSLCLQRGQDIVEVSEWKQEKSHAELIAAKIDKALRKNNINPKDIDAYCVNIGPGSFTGIRIAVNTIKTFAYVFKKPIYSFNSLETIAASCSLDSKNLIVAINAHSELCYTQTFVNQNGWLATSAPTVIEAAKLSSLLGADRTTFVGDAFNTYKHLISNISDLAKPLEFEDIPSAKFLASLVKPTSSPSDWKHIEPFYIRKSAPEEKRDSLARPK